MLLFLPGAADINALHGRLSSAKHFRSGGHMLVTLHSSVSPADQRLAFKRPPPGEPLVPPCAAAVTQLHDADLLLLDWYLHVKIDAFDRLYHVCTYDDVAHGMMMWVAVAVSKVHSTNWGASEGCLLCMPWARC